MANIRLVIPKISLHTFSSVIGNHRYMYEIVKLKESLFVFINLKSDRDFSDLSLAIKSRFDTQPIASRIIGEFSDEWSKEFAAHLAKKLDKTVYVSLNITGDRYLMPLIERQIFLEYKNYPDAF